MSNFICCKHMSVSDHLTIIALLIVLIITDKCVDIKGYVVIFSLGSKLIKNWRGSLRIRRLKMSNS